MKFEFLISAKRSKLIGLGGSLSDAICLEFGIWGDLKVRTHKTDFENSQSILSQVFIAR